MRELNLRIWHDLMWILDYELVKIITENHNLKIGFGHKGDSKPLLNCPYTLFQKILELKLWGFELKDEP